jgi:hypothetical protein
MPGGRLSGRDLTGFGILTAGLEIAEHRGLENVNVTEDTGSFFHVPEAAKERSFVVGCL